MIEEIEVDYSEAHPASKGNADEYSNRDVKEKVWAFGNLNSTFPA